MPLTRAPLREQAFRIVMPTATLVVTLGMVVIVVAATGVRGPFLVITIVLASVAVVFASGAVFAGVAIGGALVGDRLEVALRAPGDRWRHGRVTPLVFGGRLTFEPYLLQLRVPSGQITELAVLELGDDVGRRPPLRDILRLNPQLHIVDLVTDRGRFELAALPSRIRELRQRLFEQQPGPR